MVTIPIQKRGFFKQPPLQTLQAPQQSDIIVVASSQGWTRSARIRPSMAVPELVHTHASVKKRTFLRRCLRLRLNRTYQNVNNRQPTQRRYPTTIQSRFTVLWPRLSFKGAKLSIYTARWRWFRTNAVCDHLRRPLEGAAELRRCASIYIHPPTTTQFCAEPIERERQSSTTLSRRPQNPQKILPQMQALACLILTACTIPSEQRAKASMHLDVRVEEKKKLS